MVIKNSLNLLKVISAMEAICHQRTVQVNADVIWITTRDIAEACDLSIYRARYSLLRLKEQGAVRQLTIGRTHSWSPTSKITVQPQQMEC